jgi:hypothetical protein
MTRTIWQRVSLAAIAVVNLLIPPASAQTKADYLIRGPGATVIWGIEEGAIAFELTVLAFKDMAPVQGDQPTPGPRVAFALTRLSSVGYTLTRRHWYGEAALPPDSFTVASDLSQATLDVEAEGTLEVRTENQAPTVRKVKGRIEIRWVANADPANTTLSVANQTVPFPVQLNIAGQGRKAAATAKVTVDGMGGPLDWIGPATILSPAVGTLTLGLP